MTKIVDGVEQQILPKLRALMRVKMNVLHSKSRKGVESRAVIVKKVIWRSERSLDQLVKRIELYVRRVIIRFQRTSLLITTSLHL